MRNVFSPRLSGAALKTIACASMFIDHMGLLFFPQALFLRVIGRLAFPIFAFFIAEGCRYTAHPLRRFLTMFLMGLVCEAIGIVFTGAWYGNILLTFSCSILLISLLQAWKRSLCGTDRNRQFLTFAAFFAAAALIGLLISRVGIDYGFPGVMCPVLISLFDMREGEAPDSLQKFSHPAVKPAVTAVSLLLVCLQSVHAIQYFSLFALPILALYNGKPGNRRTKLGFYLFFPLHLLLLGGIALLTYPEVLTCILKHN